MAVKPLFNENELLSKVAGGDQRAFRVLYDFYYDKIYAFALYLLKSDLLAEEVVQETFLKLWKKGDDLNQIMNVESFLIAVTRNRSLDILRRSKLEIKTNQKRAIVWSEGHNDTEESIILNDTRRILQSAIDLLPPQQKLVYQLCQQEGLKYEEAADKLSLSTLTVQSYMKLALRNVRRYMVKHADLAAVIIVLKYF
jgi:RNA polymerase sigma-70 factor (family 1)